MSARRAHVDAAVAGINHNERLLRNVASGRALRDWGGGGGADFSATARACSAAASSNLAASTGARSISSLAPSARVTLSARKTLAGRASSITILERPGANSPKRYDLISDDDAPAALAETISRPAIGSSGNATSGKIDNDLSRAPRPRKSRRRPARRVRITTGFRFRAGRRASRWP